ncbi:neuritin 1b [Ictalurus furcatus]|uniref:neuritin 1b n=1 Tax=Ictalurus furcatus TaxID=66913 RepID=UPI00234FE83F|nr:neuritin 1b [Ictalurus furcatus]
MAFLEDVQILHTRSEAALLPKADKQLHHVLLVQSPRGRVYNSFSYASFFYHSVSNSKSSRNNLSFIPASLLRAVSSAGACETVFKGFSDCLLSLGGNMLNHPQDLDDLENLDTVCSVMSSNLLVLRFSFYRYWSEFLLCTSAAVAGCQDEAVELWEKLKAPSGSLNYKGSLFELCSKDNGASGLGFPLELIVWAMTLCKMVMWVIFE